MGVAQQDLNAKTAYNLMIQSSLVKMTLLKREQEDGNALGW